MDQALPEYPRPGMADTRYHDIAIANTCAHVSMNIYELEYRIEQAYRAIGKDNERVSLLYTCPEFGGMGRRVMALSRTPELYIHNQAVPSTGARGGKIS